MKFSFKFCAFTFLLFLFIFAGVAFHWKLFQKEINGDIRHHFRDETAYQNYLLNDVNFAGVAFRVVNVKKGDNFWKIAKRNHVRIDSLIGVNPYWKDLLARVGQRVLVPSENGVLEFVRDYNELNEIADIYGVETSSMIVEKKPPLYSWYHKYDGERKPIAVFIPKVKPRVAMMTETLASRFEERELFRSPLGGRLTSFFGSRRHPIFHRKKFHNGLDIAARRGTYIGAARGGRVVFAGWRGGYGRAVIIEHDMGYKTLYGHMSSILVKPGQRVQVGRIIGRVGSTGLSTGPHLHFTVWKRGKLINPLNILW